MYQKKHVGSLKETVVLRFTNGYQITLEAGVEMSMSLTMVEQSAQQPLALDVCHESPSKTHSWYGSSQGYVCEHCGTRK